MADGRWPRVGVTSPIVGRVRCLFVTHPEVVVDPQTPVTQWRLSALGRARVQAFALTGALDAVDLLVSSPETKAVETAAVLGAARGLPAAQHAGLGENDRAATGFLPPEEFERTADQFFAQPSTSVRGWETAADAQARVQGAVRDCLAAHPGRSVAFVSHGAVGTLLLCSLLDVAINRSRDQPRQGCWFAFNPDTWTAGSGWQELPGAAG